MDVSFTLDLPAVPECFSKLLISDENHSSAVALPRPPWREWERLRDLRDTMLKSLAVESLPQTTLVVSEEVDVLDATVVMDDKCEEFLTKSHSESRSLKAASDLVEDGTFALGLDLKQSAGEAPDDINDPAFCRLNLALTRLKQEMVDLRHLDMSLFCQLLSLNEAIHDFKASLYDQCSEYAGSEYTCSEYAGSEYSFGTGMGSRVASFSSLTDESEWGGDFRVRGDDPNSPVSPAGDRGGPASDQLESIQASTSSLLQQIKALTLKAEADF